MGVVLPRDVIASHCFLLCSQQPRQTPIEAVGSFQDSTRLWLVKASRAQCGDEAFGCANQAGQLVHGRRIREGPLPRAGCVDKPIVECCSGRTAIEPRVSRLRSVESDCLAEYEL